ncbi:aromatic amino acid ammonia-lyase [Diaminobutyricibacter sp. McL0608]|uniref:aromatic amino acid ammonia-lyase n=1 Tax=Leifsonia sp. McL0608 TaxID=3143537 RepID=UPI0031F30957
MTAEIVTLGADAPTTADLVAIADGARVEIGPDARQAIEASRAVVEAAIADGLPVYGLNTRLGAGRDDRVGDDELLDYQRLVIANHRGGVGEALGERQVRALIAARLSGFTRGGAGVRIELAQAYADLLNANIHPVVPARGSVGAADLTHLAEVAAVLTGGGRAFIDGVVVPGEEALTAAGLEPIVLAPHEGLAVLSSNAYSVGAGALVLSALARRVDAWDSVVALTLEAVGSAGPAGNLTAFSAEIADARGGAGQRSSAGVIRAALLGSALAASDRSVTVQDPIAFRTVPQIHGALREALDHGVHEIDLEVAARSDNPLVDVGTGRMISGGNFQAIPLALALENIRLALAHVASASERRISALSGALTTARREGRTRVPGLLAYSAAAALAEVRQLAAPATLGVTTLSGVEDHASLAPLALQLLERSAALVDELAAIEALHAVDLLRVTDARPTGAGTGPIFAGVDEAVAAGIPAADLVPLVVATIR